MMNTATLITAHHLILRVIGPSFLPMLPRVVRTPRSPSACALMHCLFAGCAHFREIAGFEQKHDPDAEQHASHEADQEPEKEFSSHRGDHGEPDAPLLIIEGGAGAFRRLSTYQKRAALAMDRAPLRSEERPVAPATPGASGEDDL